MKITFSLPFVVLLLFFTACNGQTKTVQETIRAIEIDTTQESKLDFSHIHGNFDKVYGNVHNGFQDKTGNMWFGTTGAGSVCFNGKSFNHITTTDKYNNNSVKPLLEDEQGNIWFATADGIYRYDGKIFTNIPISNIDNAHIETVTLNSTIKPKPSSISVISAIQDKKGNIWFGTETQGVYLYNGQHFANILSQKDIGNTNGLHLNTITGILEDKKGNIWFASWNNEGLCRYDGQSLINYTPKNGLGDDMIYSLLEDEAGNIWIGTRNHGVWCYDGKSFTNISAQTDLKHESIYAIKQDKNRHLWFATQSKGVWKYDGKNFINFTTTDGLHNNSVFCIVVEKNGNIWLGSRGMGLSIYDGKTFTDLTKN